MTSQDKETIQSLDKKLKAKALDGFVYNITPNDFIDSDESTYKEFSFCSEEERTTAKNQVVATSSLSEIHAEGGFSAWGVSISASAGNSQFDRSQAQKKENRSEKATTAIVTRICYHQKK